MRLFYINYADLSVAYGATVCIVELAKALAKQGHEVTVIVPKFRTTDNRTTDHRTTDYMTMDNRTTDNRTAENLFPKTHAPRFTHHATRITILKSSTLMWCQKVYFGNASVVITVTPKIAERIHEVYGIPKEKLVPIENGVNLERFKPMDKFEARRRLGLPETGYTYIGWVGYFFPWSGVETLLEAAKKVLAEFPNARFIIVGHGIWGTHLSDFAQTLGLKVHLMKPLNNAPPHLPSTPLPDPANWQVCFTGEVANELVPVFINAWDIATAPYPGGRNEKSGGSSMKIREYFGCGVPVVTTDVAGIGTRWLIGEGETGKRGNGETENKVTIGERGVLTVPDDADAFAEGLLFLIRNDSLREQMGKNARKFAEAYCGWDEVARQTVKAFEGVIRK